MDKLFLVGTKEFVTLVNAEELLLVVDDKEEENKLLGIEEDKLLLIEVS